MVNILIDGIIVSVKHIVNWEPCQHGEQSNQPSGWARAVKCCPTGITDSPNSPFDVSFIKDHYSVVDAKMRFICETDNDDNNIQTKGLSFVYRLIEQRDPLERG